MAKIKILQDNRSYTFRSYFELPYEGDDILAEFDYTLIKSHLSLPQTANPLNKLPELKQRIEDILPFISLSNETARRETLVSPILLEVIRYCHCQMRIEYPLNINNRLKGNLDYLLILKNNFLVIEAKNDDLTRGFTQLAVELIAFDNWSIIDNPILYGAVSIGNIWQFVTLHRESKQITQDINLYRVPNDLETLMKILVALMQDF